MSLKGIELQIAIPKTFDAGKIAEQKHQQTQLNQDQATARMEQQMVKNSETVLESEKYAKIDAMPINVKKNVQRKRNGNGYKKKRRRRIRCILIKVHLLTSQGN